MLSLAANRIAEIYDTLLPEDKKLMDAQADRLTFNRPELLRRINMHHKKSDYIILPLYNRRPDLLPKEDMRIARFCIDLWNDATYSADLSEIIEEQGLSLIRFRAICQKEGLPSPVELRRIVATEKAKYLLETTLQPLTAIYPECGFENQQIFCMVFKIVAGTSPLKYRRNFQNGCGEEKQ
jgi:AraC-like DNA-binding protein